MSWFILLLAGLFEISWAYAAKLSNGFSRPLPTIITILFLIFSIYLLGISIKNIPLNVAYSIWTGIGIIGTTIIGVFILNESISLLSVISIVLITTGIILLRLTS